ncbi:MAG TPA: hypothetical protein VFT45_27995 [Longimicrobium sp.]|nr:hypothetical protein [Longimicrobium sp.]
MRSNHIRAALLAAGALALASIPAAAQDLGLVEGLFDEVSAVAISYHLGGVPSSDEIGSDGLLHGAGTEVLINLAQAGKTEFELGLGASYLQGYTAREPSLDLRTSLRALPVVSLYASRPVTGDVDAYLGGSFGLAELWNAQAYDASGNAWDVEARTFEVGASAGLYLGIGGLPGVFTEAGWRLRRFSSVKWLSQNEEPLPAEWPRSLDFSGYFVSLGLQLRLDQDDHADGNEAITPPAPAGVWTLERMDAAALPVALDSTTDTRFTQVVHGVLRLEAASDSAGTYTLELNLRHHPATQAAEPLLETGDYTSREKAATRQHVLTLQPRVETTRARTAERLAGRLYLQWNGHVLVFAPGNAPPKE